MEISLLLATRPPALRDRNGRHRRAHAHPLGVFPKRQRTRASQPCEWRKLPPHRTPLHRKLPPPEAATALSIYRKLPSRRRLPPCCCLTTKSRRRLPPRLCHPEAATLSEVALAAFHHIVFHGEVPPEAALVSEAATASPGLRNRLQARAARPSPCGSCPRPPRRSRACHDQRSSEAALAFTLMGMSRTSLVPGRIQNPPRPVGSCHRGSRRGPL